VPKKEEGVDSIIQDAKKSVEVSLEDAGESVRLAKLRYAQMKEVTRIDDQWERNDVSLLASLKNAGNEKDIDWLNALSVDDVMSLSSAFGRISGGIVSVEEWLGSNYPKILEEYQTEVTPEPVRRGSNPLRSTSTRAKVSPSFG
jgi:hypothetical protein